MKYLPRSIQPQLKDYLNLFPVVGITGPRQAGKSTLLSHELPNYTYLTFDDYALLNFFQTDPYEFMARYHQHVIFDEAQKAPEIFNHIKMAVDKDRNNYGRFIVTGSSQFSFIKKITESLAGRIGLLTLLPLSYQEIPADLRSGAMINGSYPELVQRHYLGRNEWYGSYLETYLTKDVRDLMNIGDLRDFRRFIHLLAANCSQILNMSNYAKDIGVTVQTIQRWLSVLEASYIVFLLSPYYKNYGKRITKRPKVYFYDTGLVAYLTAIETEAQFENNPLTGALFENYLIAEIKKKYSNHRQMVEFYYLRTSAGDEIDLIIDKNSSRELIEIKYSASFKPKMAETLRAFQEENDTCYLLYRGTHFPYIKNINVINFNDYLQQ